MIRILLLVALALALAPSLVGCEESLTEEEKALTQRRTPPPPRPAPGTELGGGMSGDPEDGEEAPDPNAGG